MGSLVEASEERTDSWASLGQPLSDGTNWASFRVPSIGCKHSPPFSGLIPLGDKEGDYLQAVPLQTTRPATAASVSMLGQTFQSGKDMVIIRGSNGALEGPLVYLTELEDHKSVDIKGKFMKEY